MRLRAKLLFAMAAVMAAAPAANADWRYTDWKMTPQQVVAASAGALHLGKGTPGDVVDGYEVGALGTYQSGDYHFDGRFYFQKGRLALVYLKLIGPSLKRCAALRADMEKVYGRPFGVEEESYMVDEKWRDAAHANQVALLVVKNGAKSSCDLRYRPIATVNTDGL